VLIGALALVGCDHAASRVHGEGEGPLSGSLGAGGNGLDAPSRSPWFGTYGALILCSTSGDAITIRAVRYDTKVEPLAIRSMVRTVPAESERTGSGDWAPIASQFGRPLAFVSDPHRVLGILSNEVRGLRITQQCTNDADAPYTEILTIVKAGDGGAWIDGINIDYTAANAEYTLEIPWNYVACGTAIHDESICQADLT
jgi:hypothetical protein